MNTLVTGITSGADAEWVLKAQSMGHDIKQYYYDGVKKIRSKSHDNHHHDIETEHDNLMAVFFIELVLKNLGYDNVSVQFNNLLKNFYYILKDVDSLYLIGKFARDSQDFHFGSRLGISGKTAFYAEMFVDIQLEKHVTGDIPLYFFEQNEGCWYGLTSELRFVPRNPPSPSGVYAGVGTRNINENGKYAIVSL